MSTGTELSDKTYYTKTCQQGEIVAMDGPSNGFSSVRRDGKKTLTSSPLLLIFLGNSAK